MNIHFVIIVFFLIIPYRISAVLDCFTNELEIVIRQSKFGCLAALKRHDYQNFFRNFKPLEDNENIIIDYKQVKDNLLRLAHIYQDKTGYYTRKQYIINQLDKIFLPTVQLGIGFLFTLLGIALIQNLNSEMINENRSLGLTIAGIGVGLGTSLIVIGMPRFYSHSKKILYAKEQVQQKQKNSTFIVDLLKNKN